MLNKKSMEFSYLAGFLLALLFLFLLILFIGNMASESFGVISFLESVF